jgi:hypothetical protein
VQAWKLYQYIAGKVEATPTPDRCDVDTKAHPLPEARASVNVRVQVSGREVQWTGLGHITVDTCGNLQFHIFLLA